ncbi:hypothetical protein [Picrophilus oshimae]|uniref:Glycosyltransferase n=1 Tax=Picrophilus torridus (strain ATCC 700027 / DSM 9790 / JCM 10055 / NBRC 100828 / KAW 2/3) TaxID=1122961 RepID=Q6KZK3_PICTO|nr:hypothetical protein [Picrophilus oshimae]AAT43849.1 hypothetical protein PTO1264 [Picrophilus oshimae DSM 9789]SMD31083.1 hypothetical protein SAMN02745355_1003 [Picrophilus oshimae DSM 9789]
MPDKNLELRPKRIIDVKVPRHTLKISFCSALIGHRDEVIRSIRSIENIGEEIGLEYEIILSSDIDINYDSSRFKNVRLASRNYGQGKRQSSSFSSGDYIIIFNPLIEYNIEKADIISQFISSRNKKALISDFIIISRETLETSGSWKELRNGEDLDLFARLAASYGFIVYPSSRFEIISDHDYPGLKGLGGLLERLLGTRDLIIGGSYNLKDSLDLIDENPFLVIISYILSKFSRIKPYKTRARNNYVAVMEAILESIIIKDYELYTVENAVEKIKISKKELTYLKKHSRLWSRIKSNIDEIVELQESL